MPPGRPAWAAMSLYSPPASRRLCGLLWPPGGIFAPVSSRAGEMPKSKTAIKAVCRPYTAFHCLSSISIFPHRKTSHRGRQRPAQDIKQPRPAPSWSKPGYYHLFRARDSTAQRSAVWSYQAQYLPWHFTTSIASLRPISWTSCVHWPDSISGHSRLPSKSSAIVVSPPESRRHSRLIVAGLCAIVAIIVDSRCHSRYSSTTTDPAIRSSSCFWSGESPRGAPGVRVISWRSA